MLTKIYGVGGAPFYEVIFCNNLFVFLANKKINALYEKNSWVSFDYLPDVKNISASRFFLLLQICILVTFSDLYENQIRYFRS